MVLNEYGSAEKFTLIEDAPKPTLRPHDVLIAVHATSVNPVDVKIRSGGQRGAVHLNFPAILGLDVSGVVEAVGSSVKRFAPGDAVYASPTHRRQGCSAEFVAVDERQVARKPTNISHQEAATLPLVGLTAYQCLLPRLRERSGQKVFIAAGAGGVGSFAIQLAKIYGAHVVTTCSARNADFVRELGADEVIDYRAQDYVDVVRDCDIVLESVDVKDRIRALGILKRGGWMSSINAGLPDNIHKHGPVLGLLATGASLIRFVLAATLAGKRARNVVRVPDGQRLEEITTWVEEGRIRPIVGKSFGLPQLAQAHQALEAGGHRGKIAVVVDQRSAPAAQATA